MEKKQLIRNVMGLDSLFVDRETFNQLDEAKIVGIYGPNGVGKSSFKEAISNPFPRTTWKSTEAQEISKVIKVSGSFAIFDEQLVKLIRGNYLGHSLTFVGRKVSSLFELITAREAGVKEAEAFFPDFSSLLVLKEEFFSNIFSCLEQIIDNLSILKVIAPVKLAKPENVKSALEAIFSEINASLTRLSGIFFPGTHSVYYNSENDLSSSFLMTDQVRDFWKKFRQKEMEKLEVNDLFLACEELIAVFKEIFKVQKNFGYVKSNFDFAQIRDVLLKYVKANQRNGMAFTWLKNWLELSDEKAKRIQEINEMNVKTVDAVMRRVNMFLEIYSLDYNVVLNSVDFGSNKRKETIFGLFHKLTGEPLSVDQIEESISYGELNIISLAIFISCLTSRLVSEKMTVIFDDPVSSYDLSRVYITLNLVNNYLLCNKNVEKCYFMSHEKYFVKLLKLLPEKKLLMSLKKGKPFLLENDGAESTDLNFIKKVAVRDDSLGGKDIHLFAVAAARRQLMEVTNLIDDGIGKDEIRNLEYRYLSQVLKNACESFGSQHLKVMSLGEGEDLREQLNTKPNWSFKANMLAIRPWLKLQGIEIDEIRKEFTANKIYHEQTDENKKEKNTSLPSVDVIRLTLLELAFDGILHMNISEKMACDISRLEETIDIIHAFLFEKLDSTIAEIKKLKTHSVPF